MLDSAVAFVVTSCVVYLDHRVSRCRAMMTLEFSNTEGFRARGPGLDMELPEPWLGQSTGAH